MEARLSCEARQRVYVVGHGWHTGLIVKLADLAKLVPALDADMPSAEHLEIGWGDSDFYQAPRGSLGLALRALLRSRSSALQVVAFSGSPRAYFAQSETIELCADDAAYRSVVAYLAASFTRGPDGHPIRLAPSQYGRGWFYRAEGAFSAHNTCNTWVAGGLAQAGYPVSPRVVSAKELLEQLRTFGER